MLSACVITTLLTGHLYDASCSHYFAQGEYGPTPSLEIKSRKSGAFKVFGLYDANKCMCLPQQSYLLREISMKVVSWQHELKIAAL